MFDWESGKRKGDWASRVVGGHDWVGKVNHAIESRQLMPLKMRAARQARQP